MRRWMMKVLIVTGIACLVFEAKAEGNPYEANYKAQNTSGLVSMQPIPDTRIYVSQHKDEDNIRMLEQGYDMMGTSGFEGGDVSPDLALQHATAIKADVVLVYSKHNSKKSAVGRMQFIKEAAKRGKTLTEADVQADAGSYRYYASYWAKLPTPILGVHVIKLVKHMTDEEGEKRVETEDGLNVLAVIQGSPAAQAGIQRGDVLYKVNGQTVNKAEELAGVIRQQQGQEVALEFARDGEMRTATAKLNRR